MKITRKKFLTAVPALLLAGILCACGTVKEEMSLPDRPEEPTAAVTVPDEVSDPQPEVPDDIVILYTNDVHTYIANTAEDENGNEIPALSYASVAAMKKDLEAEGKAVILADAGDFAQGGAYGSLDEATTIVRLMNAAGYDVATLGNHDFDYGQFRTFGIMDETDFPLISCNFVNVPDGSTVLEPYRIIEAGNAKVAFIGISTPETISKSAPVYFQNENGEYIYNFLGGSDGTELYECVQKYIDEVKDKADYVIALGHLGIDLSSGPYTSTAVIENTAGLDAFIDGHSHHTVVCEAVKDKSGNDVVLTQTGSGFSSVGRMTLSNGTVTAEMVTAYPARDETVAGIADEWAAYVDEKLGEQIAVLDTPMYITEPDDQSVRIVRRTETNLGDFCADAYYYYLNEITGLACDAVLQNGGGIRASLETGAFSYLTAKTVAPFGNIACLVEITGQQLLDALEKGAMYAGVKDPDTGRPLESGGFLHVAGLRYAIDLSVRSTVSVDENGLWQAGPTGRYRVTDVQVYDRDGGVYVPLDPDGIYRVGGINYILRNEGDGFTMLSDVTAVQDYITEDYMVLSEYAKSFAACDDGCPHISTENSPFAAYDGYLLDYENPYGSGRISFINERQ